MRIGKLASETGVGVETVRFYEQKGLIAQPLRPKDGGYRDYPEEIVRRINFIRSVQNLGFSLEEIGDLLALEASDAATCTDVLGRARSKRADVRNKIAELRRIEKTLDILIEGCPGKGPTRHCSIIEAINGGDLNLIPLNGGVRNEQSDPKN